MAEEIAKQFVGFYYETFDNNRGGLVSLYRPNSCMTWESSPFQGVGDITEKLGTLPLGVKHLVSTIDAQPASGTVASVIVLVTGQLAIEENPPMQFSQVFHLIPDESGSYYVFNDMFRLNLG